MHYPRHPLHGQDVVVHGVKRGARTVLRCNVENDDRRGNREVPAWMFDGVRFSRMQLSSLPCVSWKALRDLRHLLDDAKARRGPDALEHAEENRLTEEQVAKVLPVVRDKFPHYAPVIFALY